jgi:ubiquinone/menaquinone biosynthesis C-methylase UbiE
VSPFWNHGHESGTIEDTRPSASATPVNGRRLAAYTDGAASYDLLTQPFHRWRVRVVELLPLQRGDVVLDVGCGTGMCFPLLQQRIGSEGTIVGLDAAPEMLAVAAKRITDNHWTNVNLIECSAEEARIPYVVNHVLFCATHDVLQSRKALRNVLSHLAPGGWVAAVGGKWAPPWAVGLNTIVATVHAPFVRDFTGFDRPWSLLAEQVPNLQISTIEMGCGYLAIGKVPADRPAQHSRHKSVSRADRWTGGETGAHGDDFTRRAPFSRHAINSPMPAPSRFR